MPYHSIAQEKAAAAVFKRAGKRSFKGIVFDIDGTLTPLSRWVIPSSLCKMLTGLPSSVHLALCTGRAFDDIQLRLAHICQSAFDSHREQKRWALLAENGGVGYIQDPYHSKYTTFFEVAWPKHLITKDAMQAFIKDKFGWHVQVVIRPHSLVVRFHNWVYFFPKMTRLLSHRMAKKIRHLFSTMGLGKDFLVQDSGIGNLIIPEASGKGKAVKRWAQHIGISLEDVLVIGDQPAPGENDEEFLSGHYGTAFSVGGLTHHTYPLPVLDEQRKKLWGPEGTEYLLKKIFTKIPLA